MQTGSPGWLMKVNLGWWVGGEIVGWGDERMVRWMSG